VDETPHRGMAALPPLEPGSRWAASWWAVLPIALVAALGLIAVSRLSPGTPSTARLAPAANAPFAPPPQANALPIVAPPSAPLATAPDAAVPQAEGPEATVPARRSRTRGGRHQHRRSTESGSRSGHRTTGVGAGLYDPDGI
ncbi:MAG: hypothetical protein KA978_23035, partial [Deltaproteobacteria bacterium]|nr:hypothetical protein [Deltaproteobacteria bacterium]